LLPRTSCDFLLLPSLLRISLFSLIILEYINSASANEIDFDFSEYVCFIKLQSFKIFTNLFLLILFVFVLSPIEQ